MNLSIIFSKHPKVKLETDIILHFFSSSSFSSSSTSSSLSISTSLSPFFSSAFFSTFSWFSKPYRSPFTAFSYLALYLCVSLIVLLLFSTSTTTSLKTTAFLECKTCLPFITRSHLITRSTLKLYKKTIFASRQENNSRLGFEICSFPSSRIIKGSSFLENNFHPKDTVSLCKKFSSTTYDLTPVRTIPSFTTSTASDKVRMRMSTSSSTFVSDSFCEDDSKYLDGTLFIYHEAPFVKRVAFKYGRNPTPKNYLITIGGLSDGLMACNYIPYLSRELEQHDITVVQILMSSSYNGFGHVRLENDCIELDAMVKFLKEKQRKDNVESKQGNTRRSMPKEQEKVPKEQEEQQDSTGDPRIEVQGGESDTGLGFVGMLGHSTGCQDCLYHSKYGVEKSNVDFMILQAPVSDRESMEKEWLLEGDERKKSRFIELKNMAANLVLEKKENEMMPRDAFFAPITARRFQDLSERNGMDDMFSSDFSDVEIKEKFQHIDKPSFFLFSGQDEYVPKSVNVDELGSKWIAAIQEKHRHKGYLGKINNGVHSLKGSEKELVENVTVFLSKFGFIHDKNKDQNGKR